MGKRGTRTSGDYVFVIRLWREPGQTPSEDDSWRGQIMHNERRRHFVGLTRLFRLIREILVAPRGSSKPQGAQDDEAT
jgi:hypothetical protein